LLLVVPRPFFGATNFLQRTPLLGYGAFQRLTFVTNSTIPLRAFETSKHNPSDGERRTPNLDFQGFRFNRRLFQKKLPFFRDFFRTRTVQRFLGNLFEQRRIRVKKLHYYRRKGIPRIRRSRTTIKIIDHAISRPPMRKEKCPGKRQERGNRINTCDFVDLEKVSPYNVRYIHKFLGPLGEILGKEQTGLCSRCQRNVARTIKSARQLGTISTIEKAAVRYIYQIDRRQEYQQLPDGVKAASI